MGKEITLRIPEKLFRLIEADAEKHQMTTAEAAACAIIDYYAGRELRKKYPNSITVQVSEETYALYRELMGE